MAADDFDTTVEQLYGGPTDEFIAQRDAATKAARTGGDKELAGRIKQLRRPTAAAALVNRLQRSPDHSGIDALLDLGERLREAQATLDTKTMKSLAAERNSLITSLLTEIAEISDGPVSGTVREQLTDTFTAAVADAEAARAVRSGRLVSSLRYSGFGEVDLRDAVAAPLPTTEAAPAAEDPASPEDVRADTEPAGPAEPAPTAQQVAEQERLAAEQRLTDARATLSAAQDAETAALQSVELAERALAAARQTAKRAHTRSEQATAARSAAEEAVSAAEADVTQ